MASSETTIDLEEEQIVSSPKARRFDTYFKIVAVSLLLISIAFVVCIFILVKENRDLDDKLNQIQSQISQSPSASSAPKNIIFFVTDGMGPAQVTLAREVLRHNTGNPFATLQCDALLVGTSRTKSSNSRITDSAAGATAFATGKKAANDYVGVDENGKAAGTVLEAAKAHGLATGMVATKSVTDATPASFSAHNIYRGNEDDIAKYQSTAGIDIILGGGLSHYTSLLPAMQSAGYTVLNSTTFYSTTPHAPVIGLFASGSMNYEIDRDTTDEPSLSEMAQKALQILGSSQKAKDKGFFLLIEPSQIDIGCHDNDPATFIAELLEWDRTLEIVKQYQQENPDTLILSLSDHETGGLALAGGAYVPRLSTHYAVEGSLQAGANDQHETQAASFLYNPNLGTTDFDLEMRYYYVVTPFLGATTSIRVAVSAIKSGITNGQNPNAAQIVQQNLNITLSATELSALNDAITRQWNFTSNPGNMTFNNQYFNNPIHYALTVIISTRAGISWSTKGHSGVDINVYASGPGSTLFGGSRENTEYAGILARLMGWNLDSITNSLIKSGINVGVCPYQDQRCGVNPS